MSSYDASGLLTELEDSDAGTFTAAYDLDGRIVSKGYPNGLEAETTYDPGGAPVRLAYTKTSNCSSDCTWIDEQVSESVHGQWRTHSWELSSQEYSYVAGRLTDVIDDVAAPVGVAGCTIRSYGFDLNSNRTAMTTRAPGSGGGCQPGAAGVQKSYGYDTADRLTGSGLAYDSFGRLTSVPAAHSGGGVLSYTYHVNDQVRTISQDGVSKTYSLDPAGRHGNSVVEDGTTHVEWLHYRDGSDSPTVSIVVDSGQEMVSAQRYIEGIDGDLAAVRTLDVAGETDETILQLSNLHGDTIATASLDPQATQLLDRFESDEFGNPRQTGGADKRYGWLGAKQRRTELASGVIQMGVRSYLPALGRFTSVDPVRGGSANSYEYGAADPVNNTDVTGKALDRYNWSSSRTVRVFNPATGEYTPVHISASVSFSGRNVYATWSATVIANMASRNASRISGRQVECREEHVIDNSCGTRAPRKGKRMHWRLKDDANYHMDFKFKLHTTLGVIGRKFHSPQFSCRRGRKGGRACRF